ncbi:hypothetical protein MCOR01_011258, partial [Pyricularia oryzae]
MLVNRGPSAGPDSFRSIVHNGPAQDGAMNAFMNQSANMPEMAFEHGPHGQFPLDAAQAAHLRGATISPAHMGGIQTSTASPFSAAEFAAFQRHNHEAMSSSSSAGPISAGPASASASSLQQHRPTLGNV